MPQRRDNCNRRGNPLAGWGKVNLAAPRRRTKREDIRDDSSDYSDEEMGRKDERKRGRSSRSPSRYRSRSPGDRRSTSASPSPSRRHHSRSHLRRRKRNPSASQRPSPKARDDSSEYSDEEMNRRNKRTSGRSSPSRSRSHSPSSANQRSRSSSLSSNSHRRRSSSLSLSLSPGPSPSPIYKRRRSSSPSPCHSHSPTSQHRSLSLSPPPEKDRKRRNQLSPEEQAACPFGDTRWPPPQTSHSQPLHFLFGGNQRIFYHLIHDNSANEAQKWKSKVLKKAKRACNRMKSDEIPQVKVLQAVMGIPKKLKLMSEGKRGKIYHVKEKDQAIVGCIFELQDKAGSVKLVQGREKFKIFGVGLKGMKGDVLLVSQAVE